MKDLAMIRRPLSVLSTLALAAALPWWLHAPSVSSQGQGSPPAEPASLVCADDGFDTGALDAGWSTTRLGDATLGDASPVDVAGEGRLRVSGDGSELYHGDDNGVFTHRTITGDFRVEVEVSDIAQDLGGQYRKACLMVRGTDGTGGGVGPRDPRLMACYVPHFPTPDVPALQFDVRFADGAAATELASTVLDVDNVAVEAPVRFAFTRIGNRVTPSFSVDGGVTWVEPLGAASSVTPGVDIELGDAVQAGVMVSSYEPGTAFAA
ncbi:MAG: hypothetical protein AAGM22_05470, partial [Acidobacteriota bacterium]